MTTPTIIYNCTGCLQTRSQPLGGATLLLSPVRAVEDALELSCGSCGVLSVVPLPRLTRLTDEALLGAVGRVAA